MARKKVKLQWIEKDSARRATFMKRKKGLVKKVSELSTLCGVNACAIIFGPYEEKPEMWPNRSDAHRVLTRFKSLPDIEQGKKMMNQESFIKERIIKSVESVRKHQKENREYELEEMVNQVLAGRAYVNDVRTEHLPEILCMVKEKMKVVNDQIGVLQKALVPFSQAAMGDRGTTNVVEANHSSLGEAANNPKSLPWFIKVMNSNERNPNADNVVHPSVNLNNDA